MEELSKLLYYIYALLTRLYIIIFIICYIYNSLYLTYQKVVNSIISLIIKRIYYHR